MKNQPRDSDTNACIRVFRNYTKLPDLAFLYFFIVKNKIYSGKSLSSMGIEPTTPGLWSIATSVNFV